MTLCTNCSMPVRPIAAFDIDGTLTEYHRALIQHCISYWGLPASTARFPEWDGTGNFEDWIGISQADYREAKLSFRQGGFKRWAEPLPGLTILADTVAVLKESIDLEVWVTTTRPWNRLDSVDPDTRFWLDQHFPVYDHLLYDEHKYIRLAELVEWERVVFVLEDLPDMHREAVLQFGHAAAGLLRRPHNSTSFPHHPSPIYKSLAQVAGHMLRKFAPQEASHA